MPIVTTIEGKIAQIAIDRPEKRNTLNSELCKDLAREFLELNDDTRVRSIVLCGHNNVFCAGLDIEEQLAENTQIFSEFQKVIDALDALSKPIVAAVSGPAVGQGAAMLYHCDLVFAGEHALFSMPGLALGQTPRYGVSLLAVKSGGYKLAAQKLLLSEPISAAEAVAMGLVNHVVEDDKVMTVAGAAALRLACLPPEAMVATKRLLKAAYMSGLSEQRKLEEEAASHLEEAPKARKLSALSWKNVSRSLLNSFLFCFFGRRIVRSIDGLRAPVFI